MHVSRSNKILNDIRCNTQSYSNSFYPDGVRCWNNIGSVLRNSLNLKHFKRNILALVRPPSKKIFDIHNSLGLKRLYQLRVCLSPLYEHQWKHKFIEVTSNKCGTCNLSETNEHYLLYCTRFNDARRTLFRKILTLDISNFENLKSEEKTKLLLYGDVSLKDLVNKSLIEATIIFIDDSKRFS